MADVLAVRDEYRAQIWAMLIQECNSSGLTKREFCQQRGISEKSFYCWLRKLHSQMAAATGPQLVQSWILLLFRMICFRFNTGERN